MHWYFIAYAAAFFAVETLVAIWYWPRKAASTSDDQCPRWYSQWGKTRKELKFQPGQDGKTIYLRGGNSPLKVEIEMWCGNGWDWLRLSCGSKFLLPANGSFAILIQPHGLDTFLADPSIKELTATLRCVTDDEADNSEIKLHLDLKWWREAQVKEEPFQVFGIDPAYPKMVANSLGGQVLVCVKNPHSFWIRLEEIGVRGWGMELRQPVDPIDISPGQTVSLPLLLTGPSSNWVKDVPAHLRAKVSYRGSWGVPYERLFTLFPWVEAGFNQWEEPRKVEATATHLEWQAPLPLSVLGPGLEVEYREMILYYSIDGDQRQHSFPRSQLGTPVDLTESLQATLDTGEIKLTSSVPLAPGEWPIERVEIWLVLAHRESGFRCVSNQVFLCGGQPQLLPGPPLQQPLPQPQQYSPTF
ncbi:MAG: hypothetical protein HQ530_04655 [Parcubacteria group bacterium]|nr:hypothetical protein [Parcubacteria group bacterium]